MTMRRFFEILPGTLAWSTLFLIVLFSWRLPVYASIFIILFDVYWLLKTIYLSLHLRSTFSAMKRNLKVDWLRRLENLSRVGAPTVEGASELEKLENLQPTTYNSLPTNWRDIYHLVVFPMYHEPYEVVRESFESLAGANYPKDKFIVTLAIEERAGKNAEETARKIEREFSPRFFKFLVATHPADLPGEIPGKGSNETWAMREAKRLIIDHLVDTQTNADYTLTNAEKQTNAENEFLYEDLTYKIRGAVFSVRKKLGLGHKEIIYQKALEEEFIQLGLSFEKEKIVEIFYEDKKVGIYRPDFVVEGKIILELKALPFINKLERRQVWQYLKGSSYKLALLINFGGSDIWIKRIVYDSARVYTAQTNTERTQTHANNFFPRRSALSPRKSALKYENILVSVFDIDTQIFPEYFGRLTYVFLRAPNRLRAIYQPIPLFMNNIYQTPALARVIAFSSTFWQMMQQARSERLTSFSSQSLPLPVLLDIGFWHTDVVSEDSRIFWQGYLRYHGDFRVEPLLYPVSMDANVAPGFWQTMKNNYRQHRRWAWGCENIPYMLDGFRKDPLIPKIKKWYWSFNTIEGFHSWATNALMIFALGWLPALIGGKHFNASLLSYSLPGITRFIIQLSMIGVASSAIVSILLLPPRPEWFRWYHYFLYVLQWIFIPVTLIVFGAFPALEAQTRLALGGKWRLGFWVTPKSRLADSSW